MYRQGRTIGPVPVFIPLTHGWVNGRRWSWCEARYAVITDKRTLADAAVDGILPAGGTVPSPEQVTRDALTWLDRLRSESVIDDHAAA